MARVAGQLRWDLCDAQAAVAALVERHGLQHDDVVAHLVARGILPRHEDVDEDEDEDGWEDESEEEEDEREEEEALVIPMADQGSIAVTSLTSGGSGFRDGDVGQAQFDFPRGLATMANGCSAHRRNSRSRSWYLGLGSTHRPRHPKSRSSVRVLER